MAAYSAVACFRQTLQQLLDSEQFPLYISKSEIENLHEKVSSLRSSLDEIRFVPKGKRDAMEEVQNKIREAIYIAQDTVEYSIKVQSSSQISYEISLKEIAEAISDVEEEAKMLAEEIKNDPKAKNLISQDPVRPTKFSSQGRVIAMENDFSTIYDMVVNSEGLQRLVIPITGLPGIGKTTLARSIYESRDVKDNFDIRAWVTISQDYFFEEIYLRLLSTMESKDYEAGHYTMRGDEQTLFNRLHHDLYDLKYLVVIDDVWDIRAWEKLSLALPDKENGSRIIVTTRIQEVAESIRRDGYVHTMQPLSMDGGWKLLCYKVFDEVEGEKDITKACPAELKETGRSIADKCKGLPLSIFVLSGLLIQDRRNVEYWKRIEEDVREATASKGDESYLDILSLSYTYLPAKLKPCFLYMGAFPEDSEVRASKLIKLWVAEGFFLTSPSPLDPSVELVAQTILEDLVTRCLISLRRKSSSGGIKLCGQHDSLRDLAEHESRKEKFFHSRKKYRQRVREDSNNQRRVAVHINHLMSLEEVYEGTRSIRYARTLLYLGPHHHHPLPFCLTFDLLRVLDAFTVYFIRFPDEFLLEMVEIMGV